MAYGLSKERIRQIEEKAMRVSTAHLPAHSCCLPACLPACPPALVALHHAGPPACLCPPAPAPPHSTSQPPCASPLTRPPLAPPCAGAAQALAPAARSGAQLWPQAEPQQPHPPRICPHAGGRGRQLALRRSGPPAQASIHVERPQAAQHNNQQMKLPSTLFPARELASQPSPAPSRPRQAGRCLAHAPSHSAACAAT